MPKTAEIYLRIGVRQKNGEPVLFSTELGALEYMHSMEMRTQSVFTEFEVREVS